jgi:CheY-like chemotaxis protein
MFGPSSPLIHLADDILRNNGGFVFSETESDHSQPVRPRILVVDDQKLIADTISEILEGAGFEAEAVYDGWSALEAAARFRPDYVLSDVLMPRLNGVQLAMAISRNHPGARIVLFSGQAGISEILQDAREKGFEFDLIAKPIHPLKLIDLLKSKK